MEMKKAVYASLLLLALLLAISCQEATSTAALDDEEAAAPAPISKTFGCDQKCSKRCENVHSRQWRCLKYCGLCCNKCKGCVPSGHYGNKDECPCYRDLKARSGKPKCP